MAKRKQRKVPFKVGDRVTTAVYRSERNVVRTVTAVVRNDGYVSGWSVSADDGGPCPECGRPRGRILIAIGADLFKGVT